MWGIVSKILLTLSFEQIINADFPSTFVQYEWYKGLLHIKLPKGSVTSFANIKNFGIAHDVTKLAEADLPSEKSLVKGIP